MPAAVGTRPNQPHSMMDGPPPSPDGSACSRHTYTHLTYSRLHLIGTAMETIKIAENGQYTNPKGQTVHIKEDLDYAVDNCVHYEDAFDFHAALKKHDGLEGSATSSLGSLTLEDNGIDEKKSSDDVLASSLGSSARALKYSFRTNSGLGTPPRRFPRTSFLVVSASWLESASELLHAHADDGDMRVGVLNSASATTPGGRFLKGTVSQEDCLCRASLLYSCISQPKFQSESRFYGVNRNRKYGTSGCVIFSPDVPVIRQDTVEGKLLDKYEKVSFVSIPAPNAFSTSVLTGKEYNDIESDDRQKGLDSSRNISMVDLAAMDEASNTDFDERLEHKRQALLASVNDRIHRALAAFVLGNCTDLVLPAFGCGVHGNDPTMVAAVFREMLTDPKLFGGRFRTVVFAVPPSRKQNYQAFAAYFQRKETVKRVVGQRQSCV